MRIAVTVAGALALTLSVAFAEPIEERQELMKSNGQAVGSVAPIAKGEKAFDAEAVNAAFDKLAENAEMLDVEALFPAGTETGGDTEAAPAIWEDREGFIAAIEEYKADVSAAAEMDIQDLDTFRAQFGAVTQNCGSCHETYRQKKS